MGDCPAEGSSTLPEHLSHVGTRWDTWLLSQGLDGLRSWCSPGQQTPASHKVCED